MQQSHRHLKEIPWISTTWIIRAMENQYTHNIFLKTLVTQYNAQCFIVLGSRMSPMQTPLTSIQYTTKHTINKQLLVIHNIREGMKAKCFSSFVKNCHFVGSRHVYSWGFPQLQYFSPFGVPVTWIVRSLFRLQRYHDLLEIQPLIGKACHLQMMESSKFVPEKSI